MAKTGRPREYTEKYEHIAYKHMSQGGTLESLADLIGHAKSTIERWQHDYPAFKVAIRKGRFECDTDKVETAMLKRACGYEVPEEKLLIVDGQVERHTVQKHIPPSEKAAIYWVKNRRSEDWQDKQEVEHTGDLGSMLIEAAKRRTDKSDDKSDDKGSDDAG